MTSKGRRGVSPVDRPEKETAAETQAPQLSKPAPLAPPPEGFAVRREEPEQADPSPADSDERAPPPSRLADIAGEARAAAAIAQETSSHGWAALSQALAAYTCRSIDIAARGAMEMLEVRTWSAAVAVNAALARSGFAEWLDSSAKISAAGIDLAAESVKPFLAGPPGIGNTARDTRRPL